jgi:hypothetical protein
VPGILRCNLVDPDMLLTRDVAAYLGVTSRRVRALIEAGQLPAHRASPEELSRLILSGRVTSVPQYGLWIVRETDLALVRDRPVGRPRKQNVSDLNEE